MLPSSPDIFNILLSGTQVGKLNWLGLSGGTKDQYKINKDYFEFNWKQSICIFDSTETHLDV